MILSHRHKFIFLKTNKTAGTSIEVALSEFCGPDDVITPISPIDENARRKRGYPGPQNFLYSPVELANMDHNASKSKPKFFNHMAAKEIISRVGENIWESYFKFCMERNPWDRVVSLYFWKHKREPRPTFSDFVGSDEPLILKRRGYNLYTINDEVVVDKICRFEDLEVELDDVRKILKIPTKLNLPRQKSGTRNKTDSYRDYFNDEDRKIIANIFRKEIKLFEYSF